MARTRSKRFFKRRTTRRGLRGGNRTPCAELKSTKLKKASPDPQQDCLVSEAGIHHGEQLGCGEQGCAYSTVEEEAKVVKITDFTKLPKSKVAAAVNTWHNEACLGAFLGNLGIAPMIHRFFACEGRGYIVMDRIRDAKKLTVTQRVKGKNVQKVLQIRTRPAGSAGPSDHLSLMPKELQLGFAKQLAVMVENQYIHMDNHIENIGYKLDGTPILFDFGFTRERNFSGRNSDKAWALAFSIFQILEHCELEEIEGTEFFRIASSIVAGKFEWPTRSFNRVIDGLLESAEGVTLEELGTMYDSESLDLDELKASATEKADDEENIDVYVGSMIYSALITMEREDRYSYDPLYGVIYDIRQNKEF